MTKEQEDEFYKDMRARWYSEGGTGTATWDEEQQDYVIVWDD